MSETNTTATVDTTTPDTTTPPKSAKPSGPKSDAWFRDQFQLACAAGDNAHVAFQAMAKARAALSTAVVNLSVAAIERFGKPKDKFWSMPSRKGSFAAQLCETVPELRDLGGTSFNRWIKIIAFATDVADRVNAKEGSDFPATLRAWDAAATAIFEKRTSLHRGGGRMGRKATDKSDTPPTADTPPVATSTGGSVDTPPTADTPPTVVGPTVTATGANLPPTGGANGGATGSPGRDAPDSGDDGQRKQSNPSEVSNALAALNNAAPALLANHVDVLRALLVRAMGGCPIATQHKVTIEVAKAGWPALALAAEKVRTVNPASGNATKQKAA